ncbi:MAG: adenylate/guanylate cyclase domain-containing protein [Bacteroidales bacterium]
MLGKENGIFIMDGNGNYLLPMKGPVYIAGNQSDTLVYSASGDVGYLVPDKISIFKPFSRKHWIPASQRDFTPGGIELLNDLIFILTDRGVISLQQSAFHLHEFGDIPKRMVQENGQLLVFLKNNEAYVWSGNDFTKWTGEVPPITHIPGNHEVTIMLEDHTGTSIPEDPSGITILDQEGRVLNRLGTRGGLPDKEIRQIVSSDAQEIWILSAHTLHKFSYPSPLNTLDLETNQSGRILNSILIGDTLFLGTSNGLWLVHRDGGGTDRMHLENLLPGIQESIHLLSAMDGQLYAAGISHLYALSNDQFEQLGTGSFSGIAAMGNDSVVASNQDGIRLYRKGSSGWFSEMVDAGRSSATSFVHHRGQLYFLCENEVYRLDEGSYEVEHLSFHSGEMILRLIPLEEELFLVSNDQTYLFDTTANTFIPAASGRKTDVIAHADDMVADRNGSVWQVRHQGKYRSEVSLFTDWHEENPEETPFPVLGSLGEILRLSFHDSLLYITGKDKIAFLDLSNLRSRGRPDQFQIIPQPAEAIPGSFFFEGMAFQSTPEPLFRYKLAPRFKEWSEWSTGRTLATHDLKHGKYHLEAQAMDLYGRVTPVADISFEVPPPFYLQWYAYVIYVVLFLLILFLIRKWRMLSYQRAESRISRRLQAKIDQMAIEKAKSDKLAAEFLPEETAEELKSSGRARWKKYERATVLFSDIQGFTKIAEEMNPEALIDELDKFFFHFDSVVEKYNIEKIKTIGDAYMAAGGIPEKNSTNPVEVVLAAIEMQAYMADLKASHSNIWDLRIGIHTGPVIAGVVGQKKVSYDIWGDTVNTASRMESSGIAGKVNISGVTHEMVKEYFICEYRGKLPVKYKGNIDMYFVKGLRPELSVDLKALPNKRFYTKLQLLRLADVEEKVFDEILGALPESFHFHHSDHARKVYSQSLMLSRAQELEQEERLLVRTASIMLFTGLTRSYNNFENNSVEIAREILPHYHYSETQIDLICNLILSTKMPFHPDNLLEKIVIDARMEYLGRNDYTRNIESLYQELRESGVKINGQQFKHQQFELLHEFEFYTVAARRLREVTGPQQMTRLEKERWI